MEIYVEVLLSLPNSSYYTFFNLITEVGTFFLGGVCGGRKRFEKQIM